MEPLLERCRQGDELAWEALVSRYQSRIYGLAYHYVRNAEEARDLAQEIFVRIYERLGSFKGANFLPWMLQIARNLCIDRLRRIKARPPASDVSVEGEMPLSDPGPTPDQVWQSDARAELVYRAMGRISETNREIIMLKEIQGLKLEEIARLLQAPIGTVKSRSNRARAELARAVLDLDPSYGVCG